MKILLSFSLAAGLLVPHLVLADGCFVPPFVWDRAKDINEPAQKAIIVHDAGHEDLILQVKYNGPVADFGWLIPVPALPTVEKGSMECFYELSRYTQRHFERPQFLPNGRSLGLPGEEAPEPVQVIQIKTIGAYEVAILSTKSAIGLQDWLAVNQFSFPRDKSDVLDSYIKQQWYFVAVKIHLGGNDSFQMVSGASKQGKAYNTNSIPGKLASGELHPLHLGFDSPQCIFPLRISSVNGSPSEVQVYVLSPEPLLEKGMWEKHLPELARERAEAETRSKAQWTEMKARAESLASQRPGALPRPPMPEPESFPLGEKSRVNSPDLIPFGEVTKSELSECSRQIVRLKDRSWWLTKQTWTFQPGEMRDLEFQPALPVFVEKLSDEIGYFAAANLLFLGLDGTNAILSALKSTNSSIRAHAASATIEVRDSRLAEALPVMFRDAEPAVRLFAIYAADNVWKTPFAERLIQLLADGNPEVAHTALLTLRHMYPQHREEIAQQTPVLEKMLKDGNPGGKANALQILTLMGVPLPREEVLAAFKGDRLDAISMAMARYNYQGITSDEAAPLLQNSMPIARMMGLKILRQNADNRAIDLLIPMLNDAEPSVKARAYRLLCQLTAQEIPPDQPEKWTQWWNENKTGFQPHPVPLAGRPMHQPAETPPASAP